MIDITVQESADEFVRVLAESAVVSAFQDAKASLEGDKELSALRNQHARMSRQFRSKQFDGTLTQEEISELRTLVQAGSLPIPRTSGSSRLGTKPWSCWGAATRQ